MKTYNERYGGWGYLHIYEKIILWLRSRGAREDQVDAIMKRNPPKLRSLG
jgi:predicted metal-dependent phosphotriesterase family hydrolase